MTLFPCSACAAKDSEIKWLRRQLQETMDRFQALTGTLVQVQDGRTEEAVPAVSTTSEDEPEKDPDWAMGELEQKRAELEAKGIKVVADFPA